MFETSVVRVAVFKGEKVCRVPYVAIFQYKVAAIEKDRPTPDLQAPENKVLTTVNLHAPWPGLALDA